ICFLAAPARTQDVISTDLLVPHVSTLAMNTGATIPLHLHRKIAMQPGGKLAAAENRTVLFVHGGTTPTVAALGFEHKDYNWMVFLAREGFDDWGIDLTGYGASARPMMDDP